MHLKQPKHLRKQALAAALTVAIGCAGIAGSASADQITMSFSGLFTMLDPNGAPLTNTDLTNNAPYYGRRTPITGVLKYDTVTGGITNVTTGTFAGPFINAFSFFGGGLALATTVTMQSVSGGSGSLLLANMGFNWNANNGIPVSLVLDAAGLHSAIAAGVTTGSTISATGALAASNHSNFGTTSKPSFLTMGVLPLASTTWDTTQLAIGLGSNPSGTVPLITDGVTDTGSCNLVGTSCGATHDVGIGGNPMNAGPFTGFNANFDFQTLTVVDYVDTTPPVVAVTGANPQSITQGSAYTELGGTCLDAHEGNLTGTKLVIDSSAVNTSVVGAYTVHYNCSDNATSPNAATQVNRTVNVASAGFPSITLLGSTPITHECGTTYTDAGATASDPADGNITGSIVAINSVNAAVVGPWTVTYNVTDSNSNAAPTVTRNVNVVDTTKPVIAISGPNPLTLQSSQSGTFSAPSATATDSCDASLPAVGAPTGTVVFTIPTGQDSTNSALTYSVTDASSNTSDPVASTLNVTVNRSEPVISRVGNTSISIAAGALFTDPGITVHDVQEGNATYDGAGAKTAGAFPGSVVISSLGGGGNLNGTHPANGSYTITYNVTDSDGNAAAQVIRTLVVGVAFTANDSNFTMITSGGAFVDGASDIQATWNGATYDPTTLPEMNPGAPDIPAADMALATVTPTAFFSYFWIAHDVHVVTAGTYDIETCPAPINGQGIASDGSTHCLNSNGTAKNTTMHVVVPSGKLGAHMLFDWGADSATSGCGKANCNIDVFVVWAQNAPFPGSPSDASTNLCAKGATWDLASIDPDGDGIPGVKMVDGAFVGFNANFNLSTTSPCAPNGGGQEIVVQSSGDTSLGGGSADLWTLSGLLTWLVAGLRRKKR